MGFKERYLLEEGIINTIQKNPGKTALGLLGLGAVATAPFIPGFIDSAHQEASERTMDLHAEDEARIEELRKAAQEEKDRLLQYAEKFKDDPRIANPNETIAKNVSYMAKQVADVEKEITPEKIESIRLNPVHQFNYQLPAVYSERLVPSESTMYGIGTGLAGLGALGFAARKMKTDKTINKKDNHGI